MFRENVSELKRRVSLGIEMPTEDRGREGGGGGNPDTHVLRVQTWDITWLSSLWLVPTQQCHRRDG